MKKSMRIALAGISGALGTLFLVLSIYVQPIQFTMLIFASVVLFLPLSNNDYVGALLSYLVASIVSFLVSGGQIIFLVGYWIFFGTHPIVLCLLKNIFKNQTKIFKYGVTYLIKLVYFNICIMIVYFVLKELAFDFALLPLPIWVLFVIANPLFIVYDVIMCYFDRYVIYMVNRHIRHSSPAEEKKVPKADTDAKVYLDDADTGADIFFGDTDTDIFFGNTDKPDNGEETKRKKPDSENSILNDDD